MPLFQHKNKVFGLLLGLIGVAAPLTAQQDAMQTQFMYNKIAFNPGYAGSYESPTLTLVNRNQWVGIEGAPNTQALSYVQPLMSNHFGLGFNLVRNTITINRLLTAEISYAYQLALPRGYLGIGLQASIRHFRQNWNDDRIVTSQPGSIDSALPLGIQGKVVPNFGAGVFYTAPRWYAGMSVPRLIDNNIDFSQKGTVLSREVQHFNLMTGVAIPLEGQINVVPQVLFKYVKNAPVDLDVNVSMDVRRKFLGGLTYRLGGERNVGESIDVMGGVYPTKHLMLMLSYDIGLTRLSTGRGTIEATVRWLFNPPEGNDTIDPNRPDRELSGRGTKYYF